MKKFIYKVICTSLPIILALVTVNYFGDAANLFNTGYEGKMADIVIGDSCVTNISNYDERVFQHELITRMKNIPNTVVIGSSRTMLITTDYFPSQTLFNNSVSGASIEDLIAIYQMYKERNYFPKTIIIGIDPWTFNENNSQSRWKSVESYYLQFHDRTLSTFIANNQFQKYEQLFSLSYFQPSIKNILKKMSITSEPVPTKNKYNITGTKLTDGSLVYGSDYRNASQDEINRKIANYTTGNIYSIENFNEISKRIWKEFQEMISDMKTHSISIELFLSPYAPPVYNTISKKYPMVLETEKIIREYVQLENIKVYGSFNPFELNMNESYFYDGMHCREKGIATIMGTEL
ncbi:MAG: hypothetical protein HOF35_11175 [Bacteroidetes bacterium]|jgi:hypothetical protein|nr:hypothetical protein [Bacteroidota bacterium]